jgi:hypothetical protein
VTAPELFTGARIRALLAEVAGELRPETPQATVLIVGGSLLAWHGLRSGTEDVDSTAHLDAELRAAVQAVAERHQLAVDWLNDHAAPWHPQTLRLEDCELLVEHPRLRVLGAPLSAVFLMKLNRSQPQDLVDMITLWPLVASDFPTARAVTEAFYDAYPLEELDPNLEAHVVGIVRRAGHELPLQ